MAKVVFTYDKIYITIDCRTEEKIKDICQKFLSEIELDINTINFLYNQSEVNGELTFEQLAKEKDKDRKIIKIIVHEKNKKYKKEEIEKPKDYQYKINYKFTKNPHFSYKYDITDSNDNYGMNDIFEVFISYKDNKEYIASPNLNYNIDIFYLLEEKKILSIEGHTKRITTIRYFKNEKDNNEYLISADKNKIVFIWDITDDYKIKYKIDTNYKKDIYSCLLIFPHNNDENFIIASTYCDNNESSTKIYSLNNGTFVKDIINSKNYKIWYLLSWYNKKEEKYYIIQLANKKIIINDLLDEDIFFELMKDPEHNHYSGFAYSEEENDYLCTSAQNGYINIWDLYEKKLFKVIRTNQCQLLHIIQWNNKYIIVADSLNKSFKIIDLKIDKAISNIGGKHTGNVICVKKVNHPIYGEALLTSGYDKTLKLWTI